MVADTISPPKRIEGDQIQVNCANCRKLVFPRIKSLAYSITMETFGAYVCQDCRCMLETLQIVAARKNIEKSKKGN